MSKALIVLTLLVATSREAVPLAYDCPTIQYYVRLYGRTAVITWARAQGYTLADINHVQRVCRSK